MLAEAERAAQEVSAVAAARQGVDSLQERRVGPRFGAAHLRALSPRRTGCRSLSCARRNIAAEDGTCGGARDDEAISLSELAATEDGLHRRVPQRPVAALRDREDVSRNELGGTRPVRRVAIECSSPNVSSRVMGSVQSCGRVGSSATIADVGDVPLTLTMAVLDCFTSPSSRILRKE